MEFRISIERRVTVGNVSFTDEEEECVKKFVQDLLKKNSWMSEREIREAAQAKFPHIDCVSAVYHVLSEMKHEGIVTGTRFYSLTE